MKANTVYMCERCGIQLGAHEYLVCDECAAETITQLLNDEHWMRVRGPYLAASMRAELTRLKATGIKL